MGKIKLLLLSTFLFGQLAFACGTTITGGAGHSWQGNASSPCPSNPSSGYPGGSAPSSGPRGGPSAADMAAKAQAEREGCRQAVTAQADTDKKECKTDVDYQAAYMKNGCIKYEGGELIWTFLYSGKSFSTSVILPTVVYPAVTVDNQSGCAAAIDSAATLTKSKCETSAENAVNQHCSRYN